MTITSGLAKEVGPKNFRVHALCPGMIASTFHDTFTFHDTSTFHDTFTTDVTPKKVAGITPFRREGRAKEITNTVG